MKILVTGGAGFIGSHITDKLLNENYDVTILDNLSSIKTKPDYLNPKARFIQGDVRDNSLLKKLIPEFNAIFHEAASVGIAQSNYEVKNFIDNNCTGTANLLQAVIDTNSKPKIILSASNTTYGEGLYSCNKCGDFHPDIRTREDIKNYGFEPVCSKCKTSAKPIPINENAELKCNSIYALSKKFQEESILMLGKLYEFPVAILKYFNVFGPRQSLSNPYTGVSAIFMSRVNNNNSPTVYEDGLQTRDFISIEDVVEANMLALKNPDADYEVFNVGSGNLVTIKSLAEKICNIAGKNLDIQITNKFRKGDIRHCVADISKIKQKLGWQPKVSFDEGLKKLFEWAKTQESKDNFEKANSELKEKGLI